MTPSLEETENKIKTTISCDDKVVISGMSGLYPKARHVKDFSKILYDKIDPITTENHRWDYKHPDLPNHIGMVPDLNKFDSQFFKLSHTNGYTMDVMARKLMEQVYQAIYDAGLSPQHLCGKNIGVYIGSCFSETEKACFYNKNKFGTGTIGCCKSMFANRISYWLDVKGPSYSVDQSCCSSIAALEAAYRAIERGECEAAIVGAGSICLHPQTMIHFSRLINMSPNGKTKSFDVNADGCVKSEAINALFLQKAKDALRIYAEVVHVKSIFTEIVEGENGQKFGFYRNASSMAKYLKEFYKEANIVPNSVEYIEAFGAGDPEIDKAELEAFEEVFCINREDPLIVGSVISNIGYTEAASGIASITKVLIGYQNGKIAANLNCNNPRKDILALKDKRMVIATEHYPIQRSYIAINNLSYNGVNAHVLIRGHFKPKNLIPYDSILPRLVTISGRHENAVKRIFDDLKSRPIDPEELALLNNIHEKKIIGHLARGYAILDTSSNGTTIDLAEAVDHFDDIKRPLWFVYSGLGCQWSQMGLDLMRIPRFADTIKRCHEILIPKGFDLIHILTSEDKNIFDSILHTYVGIVSVQIALTDVIKEIGIVPDKIIGHSVGEFSCAYADGACTLEEVIFAAYSRGQVSLEIPVVKGSMIAVGLGYQQIKDMCPSDIIVACHNGPDSCTLSGMEESIENFSRILVSRGIFVKKVQSCNLAFHSKYNEEMCAPLLEQLKEIVKNPVTRSERWVSTSVPQLRWHEDVAKYSSAEYFINNMMSPVLFEEVLGLIPSNAVVMEIAPHGLLQAILKRSLPSDCRHIPLASRHHKDNAVHLLQALGSLYLEGYNPQVGKLYPKVEFPVSTETASLSHLVDWTHDEHWDLPLFTAGEKRTSPATTNLITLHDDEFKYLQGNFIRGRVLYPFAAALVATWDTLSMFLGVEKKHLSVHFRDVHLFAQPILHEQRQLKLNIVLHRGTGKFEVSDEDFKVATGYIIGNLNDKALPDKQFKSTEPLDLESNDVYELLQERNYSYRNDFRTIHKANVSFTDAQLLWTGNWVTLIDGMIQLNTLRVPHSTVCQPTYIEKILIDVNDHYKLIVNSEGRKFLTAYVSEVHNLTKCGGIVIDNVNFHKLPPLLQNSVTLSTVKLVPHFQTDVIDIISALEVYVEILRENVIKDELNIVGIINYTDHTIFNYFKSLNKHGSLKINYYEILNDKVQETKQVLLNADVILIKDLWINPYIFERLYDLLDPKAFVLNFNTRIHEDGLIAQSSSLFHTVSSINTEKGLLELIKFQPKTFKFGTVVSVNTQADVFELNSRLNYELLNKGLLVIAVRPAILGLKEKVNQWRRKFQTHKIAMVTLENNRTEYETMENIPQLAFSEFINGIWGGEYLIPWKESTTLTQSVTLRSSCIGNLKCLKWVTASEPTGSGVIVNVHFAGLNEYDVMRATGIIPFKENQHYGMDFSGITASGAHVMGLVSHGAVASKVIARREFLWDVPMQWSLEDAATVPLAYSMAFYCLKLKADITHGMTILILGAAGDLGQALISIALAYGCTIFTTVSDHNIKRQLLELFPELDEKKIGYSRDILFRNTVLTATKGEGCDIVITCSTEELKNVAVDCCAIFGVIIDTVQVPSKEMYSFDLNHLKKKHSYVAVDFSSMLDYEEDMKKIRELIMEGIEQGYVKPLTRVIYGASDVVDAFKLLQSRRRIERVLIQLKDSILEAEKRFTCSPNTWQIVLFDDVVGIHFSEHLIHCGARKIFLIVSRQFRHLQFKIRFWTKLGVEVKISPKDLIEMDVERELNGITHNGNVEGIFTFITNAEDKELEWTIAELESVSRRFCIPLKNFVVSSASELLGKKIYTSRMHDHLPVTVIYLPPFQDVDSKETETICRQAAIDAIFKIMATATANVYIRPKENERTPLIQELASIADVKIPKNVPATTTLQELGVLDDTTDAIQVHLKYLYNTYVEANEIFTLTVQKIHDIDRRCVWFGLKNLRSLQIFYSHIGSNEVLASSPTVIMKTRAKYTRKNEFDVDNTSLCIIPGLEGHHHRFHLLCERLKLPAFTLQPGYANPQESIHNIAQRYAQILIKKMKIKNNFYLLGYESGVLLTLETAKILENQGCKGTIFCIGQSPEELKITIEDIITELYKDGLKLEDAVANIMVNLIKDDNSAFASIEAEVKAACNWEDKVRICVEELVGHKDHTFQYLQAVINAAVGRIIQLREYKVEPFELESKIVLLHSASTFDSTLQRYSKEPVIVHEIDSPLGEIVQDLRCTSIINQHLSPDTLDLFEQSNLCETYLLNGNTFSFVPCLE